jgi:hypothetical protein
LGGHVRYHVKGGATVAELFMATTLNEKPDRILEKLAKIGE